MKKEQSNKQTEKRFICYIPKLFYSMYIVILFGTQVSIWSLIHVAPMYFFMLYYVFVFYCYVTVILIFPRN